MMACRGKYYKRIEKLQLPVLEDFAPRSIGCMRERQVCMGKRLAPPDP